MDAVGLLDALPLGTLVWDRSLRLVHANAAACALLGWEPGQAVGRDCAGCPPLSHHCSRLRAALAGDVVQPRAVLLPGPDGAAIPVELGVAPVGGAGVAPVGGAGVAPVGGAGGAAGGAGAEPLALMTLRDLRPQLAAGAADQPETWRQLLGAVAHEVRQPLAGALLLLQAAMRRPDRARQHLPQVEDELRKMEATLQRVAGSARPGR